MQTPVAICFIPTHGRHDPLPGAGASPAGSRAKPRPLRSGVAPRRAGPPRRARGSASQDAREEGALKVHVGTLGKIREYALLGVDSFQTNRGKYKHGLRQIKFRWENEASFQVAFGNRKAFPRWLQEGFPIAKLFGKEGFGTQVVWALSLKV